MGKILLVDDDLQLLATYSDTLQENKHIITKVSNVLDTLHALKSEKFDLIITDLKMEKLTGNKLIDLLQLDQDHLPCPVIISSGFTEHRLARPAPGAINLRALFNAPFEGAQPIRMLYL